MKHPTYAYAESKNCIPPLVKSRRSTYLSEDESLEEADDKLSPPFIFILEAV